MTFTRGQFVALTYEGRSVRAMVLLASSNNKSLMLGFDAALGDKEMFAGSMPVLMDDDGVYRDLIKSNVAQITGLSE